MDCRADITQYTIWHKSHTEPAIRHGIEALRPLLAIDINALAELVELLLECYLKLDLQNDIPAILERLRSNIDDTRWQRKIAYLQVLNALWPNWNRDAGRKEFQKLGSMSDEEDVEIIQLHLDLFDDDLSFAEKQSFIDRILHLTKKESDRLHYRGTRAVLYLLIGDKVQARSELKDAIKSFRSARPSDKMTLYERHRLAMSTQILGVLEDDEDLLGDATVQFQALLAVEDWTSTGRADLYRQLGDTFRYREEWTKAAEAYICAIKIEPSGILATFLSECHLRMNRIADALKGLSSIDVPSLTKEEYEDYVFVSSAIAIASNNKQLLAKSKESLKNLAASAPLFRERRDSLLITVLEAQQSGATPPIMARAKLALKGIARSLTSYLVLEPNIMGIGVNVGRIIEDVIGEEPVRSAHEDLEPKPPHDT